MTEVAAPPPAGRPWSRAALVFGVCCVALYYAVPQANLPTAALLGARQLEDTGAGYVDRCIAGQLAALSATCPPTAYTSCKAVDRSNWTEVALTRACCHALSPARQWSFFTLQTYSAGGERVAAGGDMWVVELRHEASAAPLHARVFDEGNGSYRVAFLPRLPGTYRVDAWLYYSRCLGLQEFPINSTGGWELSGVTLDDWCYLGQNVSLGALTIPQQRFGGALAHLPPAALSSLRLGGAAPSNASGGSTPAAVSAPVYRLAEHLYRDSSGFLFDAPPPAVAAAWQVPGTASRLVLVGDSTLGAAFLGVGRQLWAGTQAQAGDAAVRGEYWYNLSQPWEADVSQPTRLCSAGGGRGSGCRSVRLGPPLLPCLVAPRRGEAGALHFELSTDTDVPKYSRFAALRTLANCTAAPGLRHVHYVKWYVPRGAEELWETALRHVREGDMLILNLGLHYVRDAPYTHWRRVIDRLAGMLAALPTRNVYWRGILPVDEHENWRGPAAGVARSAKPLDRLVMTEARRLQYNLYAEAAMRRAGVRVIDAWGLPVDHGDDVHFDTLGFDAHTRALSLLLCPAAGQLAS